MKSMTNTIMLRKHWLNIALLITILIYGWQCLADDNNPAKQTSSGLHFSQNPTEQEIFNARIFDEPLIPLAGEPTPEENRALADALVSYANRTSLDDFSSLTGFLANYPQSSWSGSLLLHLGVEYYNLGYYSRALDA
jgi:hypothetical protein